MRFGILCLCAMTIVNQSRIFAQEDEASQETLEAMNSATFQVPDGEPEQLAGFLKNLNELRTDVSNEYRSLTARITKAQTKAAERILDDPANVSNAVYYEAANFVIPSKLSSLAKSTPQQQHETMELVARQLDIGLGQGLSSVDVNSAYQLVSYFARWRLSSWEIKRGPSVCFLRPAS